VTGRLHICIDEVMFTLVLLKDKALTWFEYVLENTQKVSRVQDRRGSYKNKQKKYNLKIGCALVTRHVIIGLTG
jgi:hypothetical protein